MEGNARVLRNCLLVFRDSIDRGAFGDRVAYNAPKSFTRYRLPRE